MALVVGTNCGFVLVAPTEDPAMGASQLDSYAWATKFTSPAVIQKVIEIGIHVNSNADGGPDWEVGIYTHDAGNNRPNVLIDKSSSIPLTTGVGWKARTGLDIALSPNTIYWIAYQCDNDPLGNSNVDRDTGQPAIKRDYKSNQEALVDPWGVSVDQFDGPFAVYALYTAVEAFPVSRLRKGLLSGFHVFMDQYIKAKNEDLAPLKKPDGTTF